MKSTVAQRQNEAEAIHLLRASYMCLTCERIFKYLTIFLSFGICLAAIFNRYIMVIAPGVSEADQQTAATYINIISGTIIIVGMVLGFYCHRMHTEGTVLRDRYEAYVFDNKANLAILRPISETIITVYSRRVKRSVDKFKNNIFAEDETANDTTAQFDYIDKTVHYDYKLYLFVQPFFLVVWIGFCIGILVIALSFDEKFVATLINIFIPSLSIITIIGNSWYNMRLQMRQLTNLINIVDQIKAMPQEKRNAYITDKKNVRALADGVYNYRSSSFIIPSFLEAWFMRSSKKNQTESGNIGSELPKYTSTSGKSESRSKDAAGKSKPATTTSTTKGKSTPARSSTSTTKPATKSSSSKPTASKSTSPKSTSKKK